ncbi:MAG: hypothetical protein KDC59_06610 [Saprospiraceae bacterium]|nr:hypothetical protein [Saprospiraceae bacterium]HPG07613.1 hypothetical protein [Saprospiraceae bacterium]
MEIISNVLGINLLDNKIIAFTTNKNINKTLDFVSVVVSSYYRSKSRETCLIYQETKSSYVYMLTMTLELIKFDGDFSIFDAFELKDGFAVVCKQTRTYHLLSPKHGNIDLGFYFRFSGLKIDNFLFDRNTNEIFIYSLKEKKIINKYNLSKEFNIEENIINGINSIDDKLIILLSDGSIIAINVNSGQLLWKFERIGRFEIYKNVIYSVSDQYINVIDINTGDIIQRSGIEDLELNYNFIATGEHKVYDQYLFIMNAGMPGRIVVIQRGTLKFDQIIEIEGMIPIGKNNLYFLNSKLYVLNNLNTMYIYNL